MSRRKDNIKTDIKEMELESVDSFNVAEDRSSGGILFIRK
jgi:hypothetical protein